MSYNELVNFGVAPYVMAFSGPGAVCPNMALYGSWLNSTRATPSESLPPVNYVVPPIAVPLPSSTMLPVVQTPIFRPGSFSTWPSCAAARYPYFSGL
jgi:hypothetical protein